MNIEEIISILEKNLCEAGLNENTGAYLLQLSINGHNYIRSYGNLNNISGSAQIIKEKRGILFSEFIYNEIGTASLSKSTKRLHFDTYNMLQKYNPNLSLQDITASVLQDIEYKLRLQNNLAINTVARHMKVIKKYINIARKKEYINKYPFLSYTIKTTQTHRESLTEKELEKIENYRQSLTEPNETLNAFLFSCYTGLRYSDIIKFSKQDIYTINRKRWIVIRMQKTQNEIRIPISTIFDGKGLQLVKSINRSRGPIFKIKNSQQVNRDINKICKIVGIKRKITYHCSRHTCATLLLYRGVSITTVQMILGHKSVKTTQIYSAVTDLTIEKELKKSNKKK